MIVIASFVCALIPAALFILNLWFFREPAIAPHGTLPQVDVLIPARDEADNIKAAIESVFTSKGVTLDVWVYDDNSTDATAAIVEAAMAQNPRVHLLPGLALPEGWNGKQHACWQLAQASRAPLLLFLDADVRLEGDAIARCVAQQQRTHVALLSGFPRVLTVTWMEWLVLPLIQFVLLGLLPIFRMRQTLEPAYAAGCGQFMLAERSAYFACGGHAAIRATRHDGLKLPHLFREHGFRTDICDLTDLAHTRMYKCASAVWNGLAKNATEGLGSPGRIVPVTFLLLLGQVLPVIFLLFASLGLLAMRLLFGTGVVFGARAPYLLIACIAGPCFSYLPRLVSVWRFKQPIKSALLHPVGVLILLTLQWYALLRQMVGKPVGWRARKYSSTTGEQVR